MSNMQAKRIEFPSMIKQAHSLSRRRSSRSRVFRSVCSGAFAIARAHDVDRMKVMIKGGLLKVRKADCNWHG
jgi:hypothetical protein